MDTTLTPTKTELTFPGMKQQRLESTYFIKVMLSRERRVSTAAKMSAWRAREWFLLSDSLLKTVDGKHRNEHRVFVVLQRIKSSSISVQLEPNDRFRATRTCLTQAHYNPGQATPKHPKNKAQGGLQATA